MSDHTVILACDYRGAERAAWDAGLPRSEFRRSILLTSLSCETQAIGWRPHRDMRVIGGTFDEMVDRWETLRHLPRGFWRATFDVPPPASGAA